MTDGGGRPSRSAGRPPGRPPKRKVERPGGGDASAGTDDAAPTERRRRPTAPPRPWYRQGRMWFAIIAAEALAALVLSLRLTPSTTEVSLDGADLSVFCGRVTDARALRPDPAPELTSPEAAERLERQAATYRDLRASAPEEIRPDLERVAESLDELVAATRDARARLDTDPSAEVTRDLLDTERRLARRSERSEARVQLAIQRGCGIDTTASTVPRAPEGSFDAPPSVVPGGSPGTGPSAGSGTGDPGEVTTTAPAGGADPGAPSTTRAG